MEIQDRPRGVSDEALAGDENLFVSSEYPFSIAEWSAQDFSNIYVRFRPHLERHARKFLNDPGQVEEVVQEAFLYLMTSLPELDSEIGVLKFLKWKTKMLALDVIRSSSRAPVEVDVDSVELRANLPEPDSRLAQADDAAIVSMALAKLPLRQREALVAAVYEEKSHQAAAIQLGLSENAFRQLLHRSRAAFRKALIGEAETAGKSLSEILSIAAKKAAKESGRIASAAGAVLLILGLALALPFQPQLPAEQLSEPAPVAETAPDSNQPVTAEPSPLVETEVAEESELVLEVEAEETLILGEVVQAAAPVEQTQSEPVESEELIQDEPALEILFASATETSAAQAGFYLGENRSSTYDFYKDQNLEVFGGQGLSVFARYQAGEADQFVVELVADNKRIFAVPTLVSSDSFVEAGHFVDRHLLSGFVLVDSDDRVIENTILESKTVEVLIRRDLLNTLISTSLYVISIN
jgi:RNA polymerase sigma-70 factor (ECF subfamily)